MDTWTNDAKTTVVGWNYCESNLMTRPSQCDGQPQGLAYYITKENPLDAGTCHVLATEMKNDDNSMVKAEEEESGY